MPAKRIDGILLRVLAAWVCVILANGAAWAQTSWSSAQDGDWNDSDKWSANVPNDNRANLQRTDGSYTVWVTNGAETAFTSLWMNNHASGVHTTRLHMASGSLRQTGGVIDSGSGVQVYIGSDGEWAYSGTNQPIATRHRIVIGFNSGASAPAAGNGVGIYEMSGGEFKRGGNLRVGANGTGTLAIGNDGLVSAENRLPQTFSVYLRASRAGA